MNQNKVISLVWLSDISKKSKICSFNLLFQSFQSGPPFDVEKLWQFVAIPWSMAWGVGFIRLRVGSGECCTVCLWSQDTPFANVLVLWGACGKHMYANWLDSLISIYFQPQKRGKNDCKEKLLTTFRTIIDSIIDKHSVIKQIRVVKTTGYWAMLWWLVQLKPGASF